MLDLEDKVDNLDGEMKRADKNVQDMFKIYKNVQKNVQDKMKKLDSKVKRLDKNFFNLADVMNKNFVRKGNHNDVKSFIIKLKIIDKRNKYHQILYLFLDELYKFRYQQG